MAKAQITTAHGTKITVEGSPDEVAALISQFERKGVNSTENASHRRRSKASGKASLASLIMDLVDGGFFRKPKELSAVKLALEEQGQFYPVTTLSPLLLRLVRKKMLRRLKENKRWMYVS